MSANAPPRSLARADLMRIYAAAVAAVEPRQAMSRALNGDAAGAKDVAAIIERANGVRLLAIG